MTGFISTHLPGRGAKVKGRAILWRLFCMANGYLSFGMFNPLQLVALTTKVC